MPIKFTIEDFLNKANKIHHNAYDYSKVNYIKSKTKVCIICRKHGEFLQTPDNHLHGKRCPICAKESYHNTRAFTKDEFIEKSNEIHNCKYDYSKVKYVNAHTKVCIVCPEHGEFWQTPHSHLSGNGCPKCVGKNKTSKDFISEAIGVHGNIYDYSNVNYKGWRNKICIICQKHGEFKQTPNAHLNGEGCPKCKSSRLETEIRIFLIGNKIRFKEQYKAQWLGLQSLDFYLPDYKVGIQCQGEQHFYNVKHFGDDECFIKTQNRDERKLQKCQDNGVRLLYYSNLGIDYPYEVFEDKDKLLEEIKRNE